MRSERGDTKHLVHRLEQGCQLLIIARPDDGGDCREDRQQCHTVLVLGCSSSCVGDIECLEDDATRTAGDEQCACLPYGGSGQRGLGTRRQVPLQHIRQW